MGEVISLEGLLKSRAASLLCYPRCDEAEAERRLGELRLMGVDAMELRGRHRVGELQVLGKGHVGVVVAAHVGRGLAALKMRRADADRASFEAEAANLRIANGASVGPKLLKTSTNFLLMELIEGEYLPEWIEGLGASEASRLRRVLRRLLEEARRLDLAGLDHGELSRAQRHVLVSGDEPRIIDFESASTGRRPSNVTSIAHYLFFSSRTKMAIDRISQMPESEKLLEAIRAYKRSPTDDSFQGLLDTSKLIG